MNLLLKGSKNYKWIFVVGCYNSGTTLLSRILEQHPQIAGLPDEGQFLTDHLETPVAEDIPRLWVEKEEIFSFDPNEKGDIVQKIKEDWQGKITKPSAEYILEKSPPNTGRMLWLQANFPDSFFIHIVRNGYAVALGIEKKVNNSFGYKKDLLHRSAYQWKRSAEIFQRDSKMLKKVIEISYEKLTENPIKITKEISDFLHLPPLQENTLNKNLQIHDLYDKIKNQNPDRLRKMTTKQKKIILSVAYKMLKYYKYKTN